MPTKIYILLCFLFFTGNAISQVADEVRFLENTIEDFFYNSKENFEMEAIGKRTPSTAYFVTLEIDSSGSVTNVHLFTEGVKDSAFAILHKLNAQSFKSWKEEKYKTKTILIPVVVLNPAQTPAHILHMADLSGARKQVRGLIVGKTVVLGWPRIIGDGPVPSIEIK
jgi:hypothetical protein